MRYNKALSKIDIYSLTVGGGVWDCCTAGKLGRPLELTVGIISAVNSFVVWKDGSSVVGNIDGIDGRNVGRFEGGDDCCIVGGEPIEKLTVEGGPIEKLTLSIGRTVGPFEGDDSCCAAGGGPIEKLTVSIGRNVGCLEGDKDGCMVCCVVGGGLGCNVGLSEGGTNCCATAVMSFLQTQQFSFGVIPDSPSLPLSVHHEG
jgi:hypothetical protein